MTFTHNLFSEGTPAYWSGYYSTRPYMKKLSRELEATLRSAEILFTWSHNVATKIDNQAVIKTLESSYAGLSKARRNLALFQHHDAITGKLFCLSGNVLPLKDLVFEVQY